MKLFLIAFIFGLILGMYEIIKQWLKPLETPETTTEKPFYIDEEIEAIYEQIAVYHAIIKDYDTQLTLTRNKDKVLLIEKKKADTLYKVAKLEEKVHKLIQKWDD